MDTFRRLAAAASSQSGQGIIEYGLILVLVAVVIIAILLPLGQTSVNLFSNVAAALGT